MHVIYRLCSIPSTNPSPIFQSDKFRLNKLCLKSFVRGYADIRPTVYFLLDYCGGEYDEMIAENCPFDHVIEHTELGINGTCLRQYELARESDHDVIVFAECDYVYQDNIGLKMDIAIRELGLVSPYDNLNFYLDSDLHANQCEIKLVTGHHFRSVERNTMTFGVRSDIFRDNYDIFYKHGYLDGQVWYDLLEAGQKLWTPLPSIATHMVTGYMAPWVDWKAIYEQT